MFAILLAGLFNSCSLGRKLNEPHTVQIVTKFEVEYTSVDNPKYIYHASSEDYIGAFINDLTETLAGDNLIVVGSDDAEFVLVITKMHLIESTQEHTVEDSDSEYNGQTYLLHQCEVDVSAEIYTQGRQEFVSALGTSSDSEEKVKNNRTLGDLMFGTNKDNNDYRQKLLDDEEFIELSEKAGTNLAGKVSTKLYSKIKKGKV